MPRTGEDDDRSNKELVFKSLVNIMVGFLKLGPLLSTLSPFHCGVCTASAVQSCVCPFVL